MEAGASCARALVTNFVYPPLGVVESSSCSWMHPWAGSWGRLPPNTRIHHILRNNVMSAVLLTPRTMRDARWLTWLPYLPYLTCRACAHEFGLGVRQVLCAIIHPPILYEVVVGGLFWSVNERQQVCQSVNSRTSERWVCNSWRRPSISNKTRLSALTWKP